MKLIQQVPKTLKIWGSGWERHCLKRSGILNPELPIACTWERGACTETQTVQLHHWPSEEGACFSVCVRVRVYWKECRSGRKTGENPSPGLILSLPPYCPVTLSMSPRLLCTQREKAEQSLTPSPLVCTFSETEGGTAGVRWDPLRGGSTSHSLSRKAGFPFSDTPGMRWILLRRKKMPPGFGSSVQPKEKWLMLVSSRERRNADTHLLAEC